MDLSSWAGQKGVWDEREGRGMISDTCRSQAPREKKGKKEGNLERELGKDSKQLLGPYPKSAQRLFQVIHGILSPASQKQH